LRILSHPDPIVLELALFSALRTHHPPNPSARSLILVPTARLASHLQYRLATDGGRAAWVGVEIFTIHALARTILAGHGRLPHRVLSTRLREAVVRRVLRLDPGNRWARFCELRPGATRRLAGALNELREAAIDPANLLNAVRGTPRDEALGDLYASYVARLEETQQNGWTDEAGLVLAAADHAGDTASDYCQILVHGAYEWLGVHVQLLRDLASHAPMTVLMPIQPGQRVTSYAESFAKSYLLDGEEPIANFDADGKTGCGLDLASLYDEESRPVPAPEGRVRFRNTQGAAQEVQLAVHEALGAIAGGCAPREIALVARSLEPYAASIETAFRDRGLNWTSSLTAPLRRQPLVRDFLLLLEAVGEGLPRRSTAALLRSARVRWTRLPGVERSPRGELAERWSRKAGIIGGLDEWTEVLSDWVERLGGYDRGSAGDDISRRERARDRAGEAQLIAEALRALDARVRLGTLGWKQHAERLRALLDELFEPEARDADRTAADGLRTLFDEMTSLETVIGEADGVSFARMRSWLEEAAQAAQIAPWRQDEGGIRVLDAMQFRGLSFERVFLLGMNSGVFPRKAREDPVLGDRLRRRLRELTGRPLVLASDAPDEERLVLALILGGSRSRIDVSWQRADDSGRARSTSLAMREIARLAYGAPDLDRLHSDPMDPQRTVPSHPTQWLRYLATETRVLSRSDAVLLRVLEGPTDVDLDALAKTEIELRPGLRMIKATRAFEIREPGFDGRIDSAPALARMSVSSLERLGRCPLQYFFRHVLGVAEPDEAATAEELSPAELGGQVHAVLQRLYEKLDGEGLFRVDRVEALLARADEWLGRERHQLFGELGARVTRRLPVLWELTTTAWFDALSDFARRDLRRLSLEEWRPEGFETGESRLVELGAEASVEVYGRFDRRWRRDDQVRVGDYKTSGKLADRVSPLLMLRGLQLQVPLYQILAGDDSTVELLGVGPYYSRLDEDDRQAAFAGFAKDDQRSGFRQTLRTLVELARRGRYPLRTDRHCSWCAYRLACRWNHPPTLHRETLDADGRRYAGLQDKSTQKPLRDGREENDA
jgi:ATP-dependent helicase/nuclease subunit B